MALKAKYEADFADFYSAVAQATTGLESWETKGVAVEKQMDAVATSLSGAPVVADTQAMTSSMDDFGVKTVQTGETVQTQARGMSSAFATVGATLAAAFTVQQVSAFVGGVISAASEVGDLSVKLGLSTEAVQRFKFAAESGGSTIDNVGRSIGAMNDKLASGDKSTIAALEQIGLDLDTLRQSGPEEAFIAIGDAIGGIADPMERTRLAIEFFGKSGTENMQMFLAGIKEVGAQTEIWSDDQIARLKAAEEQWRRLGNTVTIIGGEMIADVAKATSSWREFGIGLATAAIPIPGIRDKVGAIVDALRDFDPVAGSAAQAASDLGAMVATVPPPLLAVGAGLKPIAPAAAAAAAAMGDLNQTARFSTEVLGFVEPKLGSLEQFTRRAEKATRDAIPTTDTWNSGLRFTSEVIGELTPKLEQAAAAIESVTAAQAAPSGPQMGTSHGGGALNLGNITFPMGAESALANYTARYGTTSAAGMFGGGAPPDFISWAKSMGLAQTGGTTAIANTFNIVDTESEIARRVSDEISRQIQRGSLVT